VLPANRQSTDEPMHCDLADETQLKELITRHAEYTGSKIAKAILANWDAYREKFVKVYPHEYKRALTEMAAAAEGGRIMGKPTGFMEFERLEEATNRSKSA
jgi:glutamate synthase (NADPH/NADH) large chain